MDKTPYLNFATVKAVIRKDMRTLWPLGAAVAAITFLMAAFFHDNSDFPAITIDFGNGTLHVETILFVGMSILVWVGTALFVVMLAQQDRATDPRNDWMARPIKAGELVLAKVLSAAAASAGPDGAWRAHLCCIQPEEVDLAFLQVFFALMECALFLALGWLCWGRSRRCSQRPGCSSLPSRWAPSAPAFGKCASRFGKCASRSG